MKPAFFTIGHSNLSLPEFDELLNDNGVELVVDIRKYPMSRANPQFNWDTLPDHLTGISYEHVAALGGLRGASPDVDSSVNALWTNESFHNYADYALSEQFHHGLDHLLHEGRQRRSAIMCSEAVWWRCHRRIVADHLIASGETVLHIMSVGRLEPASLTPGAVVGPGNVVVYPGSR